MDFNILHCLQELTLTIACTFATPVEANFYAIDSPQPMVLQRVQPIWAVYKTSKPRELYAALPSIGPVFAFNSKRIKTKVSNKSPQEEVVEAITKPVKKKDELPATMVSFMPVPKTGLMALLRNNKPKTDQKRRNKGITNGTLFVKADGSEDTSCLQKDKRMWSAINKIYKKFGKPLVIESAYRSPAYNAKLRKRSKGVAKHSMHMQCGRAIDFRIPGVSMRTLRNYVRNLPEIGGVGLYASWVHIDTRDYTANW